jgi:hypothetical protein
MPAAAAARLLSCAALAYLASAGGAGGAAGAGELRPYAATYRGIWHGMIVAVSDLKLEQTGDTWTYRSESSPRGIGRLAAGVFPPRQVSVVRLTSAGLQPLSYKSEGGESGKSVELKYDWQSHRVTGTYEGVAVDLPLTADLRDDASVQLGLTVELLAGRTPASFRVIDKDATRQYQFARDGEATLQTPLGAIATVVYRAQKAGSPRITRFWCAPQRGFIPLKVEQTRGNEVQWTLEIESLKRP